MLATLGVAGRLRRDGLVFPDTPAAIRYARAVVLPGGEGLAGDDAQEAARAG
ncbi:hypothetical protein ACLQ20_27670 [Micromonospora sp. DT46]|uniref:hypothetical protein n=1 Tax=unclassified Micromonospora TaxID=2617518 RepID=UPI001788C31D|nr:hypothetical protein [Micromonospora sp. AMSO12t]